MGGIKVTIYLEEELKKAAKKLCIDEDTSLSALVSRLLTEYIANKKDN